MSTDSHQDESPLWIEVVTESPKSVDQKDEKSRNNRREQEQYVDVSEYAAAVGFVLPVALSTEAWSELIDIPYDLPLMERNPRMRERRLLEVLLRARQAARGADIGNVAQFSMYRLTSRPERKATGKVAIKNDLLIACGPGDNKDPVITITLWNSH